MATPGKGARPAGYHRAMTTATTLLSLLDHADADELLVLLDAENLLQVLEHYGRDREALRRELGHGHSPGTLLLGLFEQGHTAAALIAILPPGTLERMKSEKANPEKANTVAPLAQPRSTKAASSNRSTTRNANMIAARPDGAGRVDPSISVAFVAYLVALIVPAMLVSGVLPIWTISMSTGVVVAAIGAGLAGVFAGREWPIRIAGMISGVLSAPGAVVLTYVWILLRGGTILRIEIALTVIIGALPGALLYALCRAIHRRMTARAPQAT